MRWMSVFLLIFFLQIPMCVQAVELEEEWLEEFDFTELDDAVSSALPQSKMNFEELVTGLISGETDFSWKLIKDYVVEQFTYEVQTSKESMVYILVLAIIAAIYSNFSGVFSKSQISEISFIVLYALLITVCLSSFRVLIGYVTEGIEKINRFMELLGPVYFMAVAFATGSSTSVMFYQFVLFLIYIVELFVCNFLLPLTQIYLVVRIISEFSPDIHLSKFGELIETIVSWSLKTLLAIVIGFNVIQGMLSPAIDSVKRSLVTKGGEALPFVGDFLGGSTEVVLGSAVLIKNGIGAAGMILCILLCSVPLIKMAVCTLLYQLLSALVQPISDKRLTNCVSAVSSGCKLLLKVVCTTSVLFLLTIAVVSATGG